MDLREFEPSNPPKKKAKINKKHSNNLLENIQNSIKETSILKSQSSKSLKKNEVDYVELLVETIFSIPSLQGEEEEGVKIELKVQLGEKKRRKI